MRISRLRGFVGGRLWRSQFARNWSYLVFSNLGVQALGMLATIRIARVLAPAGYGQYNVVQTTAGLAAVVLSLGYRNVIIRECARHPEHSGRILGVASVGRALMLLVVSAGLLLYQQNSRAGLTASLSLAAIGLLVGLSAWELFESVAFGHERMEYSAGVNLAGSLLWVVAAWAVPAHWLTPVHVSLGFAGLQLLKATAYGVVAYRASYMRGAVPKGQWSMARSLHVQSLPFYWLALVTAATGQLPILFLAERSGTAEVGLYNVGYRLISPLQMALTTALMALYPRLSQASVRNEEQLVRLVKRALVTIVILGTAGAVLVNLLRSEVVLLLFGPSYRSTADAMAYQAWYTVLMAVYSLIGTSLAATDKQKWLAGLSTIYIFLALPMLWWGAGRGATGLAAALVAGAVVNMAYHWAAFQRSLPRPLPTRMGLGLAGLLGAGMLLGWAVPQTLHLWIRLAVLIIAIVAGAVIVVHYSAIHRSFRCPFRKEQGKMIMPDTRTMRTQWDQMAIRNAIYSVSSAAKYEAPDTEAMASFWAEGRQHVDGFVCKVNMACLADTDMVEIGCGVGRMTHRFAELFRHVYAFDVSPEMLQRARSYWGHLRNVDFMLGSGEDLLPLSANSVHFVFSYLVLQHLPSADLVLGYLRECGRVLTTGGLALLQFRTMAKPTSRQRLAGLLPPWLRGAKTSLSQRTRRSATRSDPRPLQEEFDMLYDSWRGCAVDFEQVCTTARAAGLVVEWVDGVGTQYTFCSFRKG